LRKAFVSRLIDLAAEDQNIFLLIGDIGFGLVEPFAERFPERFINIGIAEQNMAGIATGLALSGKKVFCYSIANFPTIRCVEQIRNDICAHKADVTIVAGGTGLIYGALGHTHHTTEDIAIMRAIPDMTVVVPGDPLEAAAATSAIYRHAGPCYLRLGRTGDPAVYREEPGLKPGEAVTILDGNDITLIASGGLLFNALKAAEDLSRKGIKPRLLSIPFIKPLDKDSVVKAAEETGAVITIEEHSIIGGLGSAAAEALAEAGIPGLKFKRIGIPDEFCRQVGNQDYLRDYYGLSPTDIAGIAQSLLE
jgi:transketolase